ncbi:ribulose-phosphate 3-epimerase [Atopobacter sp. AH10]|uniref:ribulose-phosphate 3-epimerase n=1 Tax=Atopobacter sp. AH10 TaxID=2315861 RepID=UPI000EF24144|nr:ribulose-phosphate 3-epimerase [Atopobacter sp. AH10]RLK64046.1 ribulose-phosphate 3-epimerase [Atopobacter sp. AH10]
MSIIAPSLLSANFACLRKEITDLQTAGADWLHFDVMDGNFVENISFGLPVLKSIRPLTNLAIDCHLMIAQPEKYVEAFADAGADIITVHAESSVHLHALIAKIQSKKVRAGLAINPGTPVSFIKPLLHMVDMVLVMTVNPGFGGQSYIKEMEEKVKELNHLREKNDYHFEIEVDGGINEETAKRMASLGADIFVAGSYVFKHKDYSEGIKALIEATK